MNTWEYLVVCVMFQHYLQPWDKLTPRARDVVFMRYPQCYKGYKAYDLKTRTMVISRNVIETIFPFHHLQQDQSTLSRTLIGLNYNTWSRFMIVTLSVKNKVSRGRLSFCKRKSRSTVVAPSLCLRTSLPRPYHYSLLGVY